MTGKEAIAILKRMQEPEAWEPQINESAFEALELAISALECKDNVPDTNVGDIIHLDWIQRYADDWEDMNYAYDNPILGMLEDWRREQDE